MRGPIDFIVVAFQGNKFDGSILGALGDAIQKGIIGLVALTVIRKDADGTVTILDAAESGVQNLPMSSGTAETENMMPQEDIDEVSGLLEKNTAAGLLVFEHLWARPLKQAIVDANGVLVADGRIHPGAAAELAEMKG